MGSDVSSGRDPVQRQTSRLFSAIRHRRQTERTLALPVCGHMRALTMVLTDACGS